MIDFKFSIEDAQKLLHHKMKHELMVRQKQGLINNELTLSNVSYNELFSLLESSIFDLILLLPLDLILSQNDIFKFIEATVHSLAGKIKREELLLFSAIKFKEKLAPLLKDLLKQTKDHHFAKN